jgi:uncharacterized membrane protein YkvA (DUF1232 family)
LFRSELYQLKEQITQLWLTLCHCWQDRRVSVIARLFVLLASIYLICPWDLHPDWQAGGYIDDLFIVSLLLVVAWHIIPRAVWRDARAAARLGKRAAAFGVICAACWHVPCQVCAAPVWSSPSNHHLRFSMTCRAGSNRVVQLKQFPSLDRSVDGGQVEVTDLCPPGDPSVGACPGAPVLRVAPVERRMCFAGHSPPVLLTTRGGQYQLYASEDASAPALAHKLACLFEMPLRNAHGIFVSCHRRARMCPVGVRQNNFAGGYA